MRKLKRSDDKYWTGTRNFNNIQFIGDLEDYISTLCEEIEQLCIGGVINSVCKHNGKTPIIIFLN